MVTIRPNGFASAMSISHQSSISDIIIMHNRIKKHVKWLRSCENEEHFDDSYALSNQQPDHWTMLIGKGYQGASEVLRSLITRNKPPSGVLERDDERFNNWLCSDRFMAENFLEV